MRNIVCLCERHHGLWKPLNPQLYWLLIRHAVGDERWRWLERAKADKRASKVDWAEVKRGLERVLEKRPDPTSERQVL